jgi:6-pyruvoyl-tetrahydropterin synthase
MNEGISLLGPAELCIERTLEFHAAHQLSACSESPECMEIHGHTYKLLAQWRCVLPPDTPDILNNEGMLANFARLKRLLGRVEALFDHTFINEVELPPLATLGQWSFGGPAGATLMDRPRTLQSGVPPQPRPSTAENLTLLLFHYLHELGRSADPDLALPAGFDLAEVRLWETPKNCVIYRRTGQDWR